MEAKTKVSRKAITPFLEEINPIVSSLRVAVEKMPSCTKRKSLLITLEALEKKTAIMTKEVSEQAVMDFVNKHPEVLAKLAKFAASDVGAVEVASEVVTPEDIKPEKTKKRR